MSSCVLAHGMQLVQLMVDNSRIPGTGTGILPQPEEIADKFLIKKIEQ